MKGIARGCGYGCAGRTSGVEDGAVAAIAGELIPAKYKSKNWMLRRPMGRLTCEGGHFFAVGSTSC